MQQLFLFLESVGHKRKFRSKLLHEGLYKHTPAGIFCLWVPLNWPSDSIERRRTLSDDGNRRLREQLTDIDSAEPPFLNVFVL
jgi:hypothetical protein